MGQPSMMFYHHSVQDVAAAGGRHVGLQNDFFQHFDLVATFAQSRVLNCIDLADVVTIRAVAPYHIG